jgi:hypothetical protein
MIAGASTGWLVEYSRKDYATCRHQRRSYAAGVACGY